MAGARGEHGMGGWPLGRTQPRSVLSSVVVVSVSATLVVAALAAHGLGYVAMVNTCTPDAAPGAPRTKVRQELLAAFGIVLMHLPSPQWAARADDSAEGLLAR